MILIRSSTLATLLIAATQVSGQAAAQEEPNHFRHEESVKVTFDPHVVLTRKILMQLASSPAVERQAIRDVNGKALEAKLIDERILLLGDERLSAGVGFSLDNEQQLILAEGTAFGTLYAFIARFEAPPEVLKRTRNSDAEYQALLIRYHEAVRKRFEEALDAIAKREFAKHADRLAALVEVDRELALATEARLSKKRMQLREVRATLPQGVLEESVSNLMKQQQSLELDVIGLNEREALIRAQVKEATELLKKVRPDEEILAGLNRVLDSRVKTLDRLRTLHKQGVITGAEIAKAEEEITTAQMEIQQARRDAGKGASDRLDKLTAELANIAVALTEARVKRDYARQAFAELQELLEREISSAKPLREDLAAESAIAMELAAEARKREVELRRLNASYLPARVEVFDLKAIEEKPTDAEKVEKK